MKTYWVGRQPEPSNTTGFSVASEEELMERGTMSHGRVSMSYGRGTESLKRYFY